MDAFLTHDSPWVCAGPLQGNRQRPRDDGDDGFPRWSAGFGAAMRPSLRPSSPRSSQPPCLAQTNNSITASEPMTRSPRETEGTAALEPPPLGANMCAKDDIDMAEVDVEEQRRILRDIEMRREATNHPGRAQPQPSAPTSAKRPASAAPKSLTGHRPHQSKKLRTSGGGKAASGAGGQRSILSMFHAAVCESGSPTSN